MQTKKERLFVKIFRIFFSFGIAFTLLNTLILLYAFPNTLSELASLKNFNMNLESAPQVTRNVKNLGLFSLLPYIFFSPQTKLEGRLRLLVSLTLLAELLPQDSLKTSLIIKDLNPIIEHLLSPTKLKEKELRKTLSLSKSVLKVEENKELTRLLKFLEEIVDQRENLQKALGFFGEQKYLILFQNNYELRPSGGFIGSFAIVSLENGRIKKLEFEKNIYKTAKKLFLKEPIKPPKPFLESQIASLWALYDANWSPDFLESASTILNFYSKQYQDKAEGVIAMNANVFEEILKIIGPIQISRIPVPITAENFFEEVEYEVEKDYYKDKSNWAIDEPKQAIEDLAHALFAKLSTLDKEKERKILRTLARLAEEKHIMIALPNSPLQSLIQKLKLDGCIKEETDFMIVNSNLGGLKSSRNVSETITMDVSEDIVNVTIQRTHKTDGSIFDGDNLNYTRVLLPLGSEVLELSGYTRFQPEFLIEGNKLSVGFWFDTPKNSTREVKLRYKLAKKLAGEKLYLQKQPGVIEEKYIISGKEALVRKDGYYP